MKRKRDLKAEAIMVRWAVLLVCCCLAGCQSREEDSVTSFAEQQKQLVHRIDHKAFYDACQTLMRLRREGKLSRNSFYRDDTDSGMDELPNIITSLNPAHVRVDEVMVHVTFSSDGGTQMLTCISNEFGEPPASGDGPKGMGFRSDPVAVDHLSGSETLAELNEKYDHFQMELIPGLMYMKGQADPAFSQEGARQSNEQMDMFMDAMEKTLSTLAIKKQQLLYRTDHHELLKACRQVITLCNEGTLNQSKIIPGEASAEDIGQVPQIILDLEPVYIWPSEGRVMVALIGGFDHAGVSAYLSDDATAEEDQIKLVDGLMYYDDGLREADEDYKDYLASLKKEADTYLDWKRKQMNLPVPK